MFSKYDDTYLLIISNDNSEIKQYTTLMKVHKCKFKLLIIGKKKLHAVFKK